ncbi:MAG TPA: dihydrolipoyl dehydrogenase [Thermotogota bacterium]|nr:dihydrolipoyl dehydrogenase [Thermotogota bacterium]
MDETKEFDLVVLGAGPGGYVGAIRATQLGMSVAVVEEDKPGGVCLNIGCIPSKALIHQAQLFSAIPSLQKMGIVVDTSGFAYQKVWKSSRLAARKLSKSVEYLLQKNGVTYFSDRGAVSGPHSVTLASGKTLQARNILVATGSRPREIPGFAFDGQRILSSTDALLMESLPKRMLILGAGAIGVEFAHVFNAFGVEVFVVEMLESMLPLEDRECVEVLENTFKKRKIKLFTSCRAKGYSESPEGLSVVLAPSEGEEFSLEVDKVLVAVGRTPNTDNIGLEKLGVALQRGFIPVQDGYQTVVPSVYAAGDVVDSPLLAHVASKEAEIAVEHMAGHVTQNRVNPDFIPGCVYCEPELGSVGKSEHELKALGVPYQKAVFPFRGAGKSVAIEKTEGLFKVLVDPGSHRILGVHIVGEQATELIHEMTLAMTQGISPAQIAGMIHAHPTLSEGLMELMRVVEGWPIHV